MAAVACGNFLCHSVIRLMAILLRAGREPSGADSILVADVTDDFPFAIGLLTENLHARLFRKRLFHQVGGLVTSPYD
jgi:hypothetical protein